MTAQPAMPSPKRLIRKSATIIRKRTGCSKMAAAAAVFHVTEQVLMVFSEHGQGIPPWLFDLRNAAEDNLARYTGTYPPAPPK